MNLLLILSLTVPAAEPLPEWGGFRGDGSSRTAARDLPLKWSEKDGVAWKVTLPGYGQSSPVVRKDRVYLTAVEGEMKDRCVLVALDAASGKKVWQHAVEAGQKGKNASYVSRAAPTPCVDENGVYAFFESGDLLHADHAGKEVWHRSLSKEYGEFQNNHGLASSPAQSADALYVLVDHRGPSYLLAVDKKTGKNLWKTDRTSRGSWTSPLVVVRDGKAFVIVSSGGTVDAYDAATGKQVWSLEGLAGNTIPSPTADGDLLVIGASEGRTEATSEAAELSNCCLKLVEKDGKPGYEVLWKARKVLAHHASPLLHRGRVYVVNKAGVLFCLDAKTGKELFSERLPGPCWPTPVAAGDRVYFFGKDGWARVIKAASAYEELAGSALWDVAETPRPETKPEGQARAFPAIDPVVYGVAPADGAFYVRTGTSLYRIK